MYNIYESRLVKREVVLDSEAIKLGVDEKPKVNDKVEEQEDDKSDVLNIPDKVLFGYDLKKIKGYREKRAQLKDEAMKKDFVKKSTKNVRGCNFR
jgi:outer membrane protein OmpA-like peptidoglycan-associated protein